MLKTIITATLALSLVGCSKPAEYQASTNNPEFKVERLFEHQGCQVYRFWDNRAVYYVVCSDGTAQAEWVEGCGKGCTRLNLVPTTQYARVG
jgi:hypothetical protein